MAALLSGCAMTTKPEQDLGFSEVDDLTAYDGCYENCSDTRNGSAFACLSAIFWPNQFGPADRPDEILGHL